MDLVSARTWIKPLLWHSDEKILFDRQLWSLCAAAASRSRAAPQAESQPAPGAAATAAAADTRPAIVCFGDSITAGFGLDAGQSFPDLLQQDLDRRGLRYRVVNLGVSGDTTQDGLARLPMALAEKPAIVMLELGGNDGLRGMPIAITQANLAQMIEAFQKAGRAGGAGRDDAAAELRPGVHPEVRGDVPRSGGEIQADADSVPAGRRGRRTTSSCSATACTRTPAGARKVEALVMKTLEPLLK